MARDVYSPEGYMKGIGYTGGSGNTRRPLEPLERRGRDKYFVRSNGKSYIRREAYIPLGALG
jgi:hypothetical protein